MDNSKKVIGVIVTFVLLFTVPLGSVNSSQTISSVNPGATPSAINILQMLLDPELETEPDAFVSGSSGEFDFAYIGQTMLLNWTHTKDTELSFRSSDDSSYPSYNDFVFFTQSFDWQYEEMPEDDEMDLNISVTLSGVFLSEPTSQSMFRVYAWLIDSSGNWARVYYTDPPYTSIFQERRIDLNHFDIVDGWQGMIEDSSGVQEDPEDILTVGIGLAPTNEFNSSLDSGTVIVEVDSEFLYVVMQAEPDSATHLTPLYNRTFGTTIGNFYPGFVGDDTPLGDTLNGMTKDPDGNLYLTGYVSPSYEYYVEHRVWKTSQFLIKYGPRLNQKWLVRNDNLTRGYAIAYHNGNLFTSGMFYGREDPTYDNLMLTKWSTNGQKIWEKKWGGAYDQVGIALGVHNDGSIYVVVSDYNIRSEPVFQNSSLLKFDTSGNVLWNKPLPLCTIFDVPGKLWVFESRIIYFIQGLLMCMDLDGNVLWQRVSYAATCDEDENIYSGEQFTGKVALKHYNLDGNETLLNLYELEYPNGWFEWLFVHDVTITPNDELIMLVQGQMHDYSYHLLKYDIGGSLQQTWSIGNEAWPVPGGYLTRLEVTSAGLLYCSFVPMTWDVWTQAYVIGDYTLPAPGPDMVTMVAAGGGIAAIVLIGVFVYKRKQV